MMKSRPELGSWFWVFSHSRRNVQIMILEKTFDLIPPQLVHLPLNLKLQNLISVSSVNVDQLIHVNSPLYLPAICL